MNRPDLPQTGDIVARRMDDGGTEWIAAAVLLPATVWDEVTTEPPLMYQPVKREHAPPARSLEERIRLHLLANVDAWCFEDSTVDQEDEPADDVPF